MIDMFYSKWKDEGQIVIFGYGHTCKNSIDKVEKFCRIEYILDNNKELDGKRHDDKYLIKFFDNCKDTIKSKILISTHYKEIKQQLEKYGWIENVDFCSIERYLTIMDFYCNNRIYLNEIHLSVTTKCTLNCDKCNMFMPEYKHTEHFSVEKLKSDINLLFQRIDSVTTLALLGGEPLLYPNLVEILNYLVNNFSLRITNIEIITNGTLVPSNELLKVCKENRIFFRISDYSAAIKYKDKLERLKLLLKENGIEYFVNENLTWLDFGFPQHPINLPDEMVRQHMLDCAPAFKGMNDGKLYYCHVEWSAVKAGIYEEKDTDYFDLMNEDRKQIIEYLIGEMKTPVSLCKYCAGCSSDNKNVIPVGRQRLR